MYAHLKSLSWFFGPHRTQSLDVTAHSHTDYEHTKRGILL